MDQEQQFANISFRLSNVESNLSHVDTCLSNVESHLSHVDTRLSNVEGQLTDLTKGIGEIKCRLPYFATREELKDLRIEVKDFENKMVEKVGNIGLNCKELEVKIEKTKNSIICWLIGIALTSGVFNHFILPAASTSNIHIPLIKTT